MGRFAEVYTEEQREKVREAGLLPGATARTVTASIRAGLLPPVPREMPQNTVKEYIRQGRRRKERPDPEKADLSDTGDALTRRLAIQLDRKLERMERYPEKADWQDLKECAQALKAFRLAEKAERPQGAAAASAVRAKQRAANEKPERREDTMAKLRKAAAREAARPAKDGPPPESPIGPDLGHV